MGKTGEQRRKRKKIVQALVEAGMDEVAAELFAPKLNVALTNHGLAILPAPRPDSRVLVPRYLPNYLM